MTATSLFLAGRAFNLMGRGTLYSSDQNAYYPRENVANNDPSVPFKFGSIQADGWHKVDLNHVTNGDMETFTGSTPTGWTASNTGSGTTSQDTSVGGPHSGLAGLRCTTTPAGGSAGPIVAFTARSGEEWRVGVWMFPVTGTARLRVYNATTGKYLTAAGAWTTVASDCATETNPAYAEKKVDFTIEDYSTCRSDTVTLLVRCYVSGVSQDALFDDVTAFPGVNFFSLHGHNIEANCALSWYYSDDDSAYTSVRRETPAQPSFYGVLSATAFHQWWKFEQSGTPYAAAGSWGELVLGQAQTLTTDAQHPAQNAWTWGATRPQVVNVTPTGRRYVSNRTMHRQRVLRMPYFQKSDASYTQFRDEIMGRCDDGAYPVVVVPDNSKGDVLFAQIPAESEDRQDALTTAHKTELMLMEMPFGLDGL